MQEERFISVNGINIAYTVEGTGDPMIFIHGNSEDHTIFDKTVEMLSPYFTCYCPDSRGHGKSSPVDELHYQDMVDDVLGFIEALNLQNVSICGFSDGGIIGLMAASQYKKLRYLIACGANTDPLGVKGGFYALMRLTYCFKKDPKIRLMLEEPHITPQQLAEIEARTLILAGEKDLIRTDHTRKLAGNLPGCSMRIISGESHGSYIVHSDKLARVIRKWLRLGTR